MLVTTLTLTCRAGFGVSVGMGGTLEVRGDSLPLGMPLTPLTLPFMDLRSEDSIFLWKSLTSHL